MASAFEAAQAKTQLASDIAAGLDVLDLNQEIVFTKYVKLVLPLDGYIFWVRADLVSQGALMNAQTLNTFALGAAPEVVTPAATLTVKGSLHYATDRRQEQAETMTVRQVVFTAQSPVKDFAQIGPSVIYIGEFDGLKFSFSRRAPFYRQADTHHYVGDAVYSVMQTQLVDSIKGLNTKDIVVSNSLPLWLALNQYVPPYAPDSFRGGRFLLYPSFAVPQNLPPPFGSVHIDYAPNRPLQATPYLDRTLAHSQLIIDRVTVTTYGLRNFEAMDFIDCVYQYSMDTDVFGVMNVPTPRDEKMIQAELGTLAQKKTTEFEINYYQSQARNIARQLITSCVPTFRPQPILTENIINR